tara:strand:+ start:412 stop:777 length:366 start_codon:yes stop_codon:yes gene_type:complete
MIGIGIDLVDVERFRRSLLRTPSLKEKLFRSDEQAYAEGAADPTERYAARFAAKEATLKALGLRLGSVPMYDIEILKQPSGQPDLLLHGAAAAAGDDAGVTKWLVTISHTDLVAQATVIAL